MSRFVSIVFGITWLSLGAKATECPEWTKDPSIPECPKSGKLLSEDYPALAYVVSDMPAYGDHEADLDKHATWNYVREILMHSGDQVPYMILPVSADTCQSVKEEIRRVTREEKYQAKRDAWLSAIHCLDEKNSYSWQQDFFQPFFDPDTGMPVLREIRGYFGSRDVDERPSKDAHALMEDYAKVLSDCSGTAAKDPLPPESETAYYFQGADSGGNITGLPGGICLHGSTQDWNTFTKYYCEDRQHEAEVDTHWLRVGHADEIFNVVPKEGNAPCNFSIIYSSPELGLKTLKENPDEKFLDLPKDRIKDFWLQGENKNFALMRLVKLCDEFYHKQKLLNENPVGVDHNNAHFNLLPSSSEGADGIVLACRPENMTNRTAYEVMSGTPKLQLVNSLVDERMASGVDELKAQYKTLYPECSIDFIPVPDLYYGPMPVKNALKAESAPLHEQYSLANRGQLTILPAAANGVVVGKDYLASNSFNPSFRKVIEANIKSAGAKDVGHVDTWSYAHSGYGNLHCTSQKIPFCRPIKKEAAK